MYQEVCSTNKIVVMFIATIAVHAKTPQRPFLPNSLFFNRVPLTPNGSMYKTSDHLRCFSAYSFSPRCRAARFIPRLTKTQVTPRRSNNKSSFCNTVEQTNLYLPPPLLSHITFSRKKKCKRTNSYAFTDLHLGLVWTSLSTDVFLFFSSKIRQCARCENEREALENRLFSLLPTTLRWRSTNLPRLLFSYARSTMNWLVWT